MPQSTMTLVARVTGDPLALEPALRASVAELDATVPVSEVRLVRDVVASSVARQRFTMFLVAAFATLAVVLGALGIYGLMSYLVSQREREIGVRMALGASPREVQWGVIRRATTLAAAGAAVGVAGALGATRLLAGLLHGVSVTDLFTFVNVPVLFVTVALAASWFPARRAMRADPSAVLRGD
jgi:ABC-type antimicrobial peptide transport system permease subunit